jgi:membrane-associated phospholipid phosphatase
VTALELDRRLLLALRHHGHARWVERSVALYSRSGEHALCWLALGAVGAVTATEPERRARWRRGVATVAGAYVLNYAVKRLVRRPRPVLEGLPALTPVVSGLSFPSAHATTSFAAAFAYPAPKRLLYAAAGLFGLSRPYLGVHYPSDVLAGAMLGTLTGAIACR